MQNKSGDKIRIRHILDAITEIENYVHGADFNIFQSNSMMKFAIVKQIEIIGEAANHISEETKQEFSDIDWRNISGMRNILVHEYFGIDENIIWGIITKDIPVLQKKIQEILKSFES